MQDKFPFIHLFNSIHSVIAENYNCESNILTLFCQDVHSTLSVLQLWFSSHVTIFMSSKYASCIFTLAKKT